MDYQNMGQLSHQKVRRTLLMTDSQIQGASVPIVSRQPNWESLHDEPEYQATLEEIEADAAAQLERVREVEEGGDLEPIPGAVRATR